MGENADVDALGVADESIERCATDASAPTAAEVVADKDLRDAMKLGVVENHTNGVLAVQDLDMRMLSASQRHVSFKGHSIFGGEILLSHVHREQLTMKTIGVPPTAGEHRGGIRSGGHAHQDSFLGTPRRLDTIQPKIGLELMIDDIGGE
jgi:hypothetical protein